MSSSKRIRLSGPEEEESSEEGNEEGDSGSSSGSGSSSESDPNSSSSSGDLKPEDLEPEDLEGDVDMGEVVSRAKPPKDEERGFPTPFETVGGSPLTIVEGAGIRMYHEILSKPNYWTKINDEAIAAKWRKEALRLVSDKGMVDYVLDKIKYEVSQERKICSPFHGCLISDTLIDESLKNRLLENVELLEKVPARLKDWHPNSNEQVLDLIHPSLYCYSQGKTASLVEPIVGIQQTFEAVGSGSTDNYALEKLKEVKQVRHYWDMDSSEYKSENFQWIPSDVAISEDGKPTFLSYINNLHPVKHAALYTTITDVFEQFVPLFDLLLKTLKDEPYPTPLIDPDMYNLYGDDEPKDYKAADFDTRWDEWNETKQPKPIKLNKKFEPTTIESNYTIKGKTCQVIVKMANIELTPAKPSYAGGVWHVEGMMNESIVASGIYYYDNDNIASSRLEFRRAIGEQDVEYEQNDDRGVQFVFGLQNEGSLNQHLGHVHTIENRCLVWPNVYQHKVSPFELMDKNKKGHRKILVFFLIDPNKKVISTSKIPPQQRSYMLELLHEKRALFPLEGPLVDLVHQYMDFGMSLEEAKDIRLRLMAERATLVQTNTSEVFERPFSLCEH